MNLWPEINLTKLEKMFLPFGVGPFISKTIIEHHGGELLIEKTSPDGTTVLMRLPLI